MKKLVSLLLALLFTWSPFLAAAEIDMSVFETDQYSIQYQDTSGLIQQANANFSVFLNFEANGMGYMFPCVFIYKDNKKKNADVFTWVVARISVTDANSIDLYGEIEKLVVSIGDTSYTFTGIEDQIKSSEGQTGETILLNFAGDSYPLLEAVAADPTADVRIKLVRRDAEENFQLDDSTKQNIAMLYQDYVKAGGLKQSSSANKKIQSIANPVTVP